jgi:flagella basal body P-ring formation protein FlgA
LNFLKKIKIILLCTGLFLQSNGLCAEEVYLKTQELELFQDNIMLGDIFDGLPDAQKNQIIGPTPGLGKKNLFPQEKLKAIAQQFGHEYLGTTSLIIKRKSRLLNLQQLIEPINMVHLDWIESQNNHDFFKTKEYEYVLQSKNKKIEMPLIEGIRPEIVDYIYSPQSNFFSAKFQWVSDDVIHQTPMSFVLEGYAYPLIQIPVSKNPIMVGKKINHEDLTMTNIRLERLHGSIITNHQDLIGMVAQLSILPHQPIQSRQVKSALMIRKNAFVMMQLKTSDMAVATQGKAMAEGRKGEFIPVMNMSSKKILQGKVIDENLVEIQNLKNVGG